MSKRFWYWTLMWIGIWSGGWLVGFFAVELFIQLWVTNRNVAEYKLDQQIAHQSQIKNTPPTHKVPVNISIPDIDLDLEVVPGIVTSNNWQVSDKYANYLVGSGVIGESGNVVVYAHRREGLFVNLDKLRSGSTIILRSQDYIAEYLVKSLYLVNPNEIHVLEHVQGRELTLYTCNGWRDEKRLVVKSVLKRHYQDSERNKLAESN